MLVVLDNHQESIPSTFKGYILAHWRGEFKLARTFWINCGLVNVGLTVMYIVLVAIQSEAELNPRNIARSSLIYFFVLYLVFPWQAVGLWRSANRHIEDKGRKLWARYAKFTVVMGVISSVFGSISSFQEFVSVFDLAVGRDQYSGFKVQISDDGTLVRVNGRLGIGVSDEVKSIMKTNSKVTGIVLDSPGGWVYEGRQISNLIKEEQLDTYTITGCYSACTIAFVSGKQRTLAHGANIAFHQYSAIGKGEVIPSNPEMSQEIDLQLFSQAGVDSSFLDRLYSAEPGDFWYPTIEELLSANVVHEIVDGSDFWPFEHEEYTRKEIEADILESSPVFHIVKSYEPDTYNAIIDDVLIQLQRGGSRLEIQETARNHISNLEMKLLPYTSDNAILDYIEAYIEILKKLETVDSIQCVKYLDPDRFGPVDMASVLEIKDFAPMQNALVNVITDRYETSEVSISVLNANLILDEIFLQLGDDAAYLDTSIAVNKEGYAKTCQIYIKFFETVLSYDKETAGNVLRYSFSSL